MTINDIINAKIGTLQVSAIYLGSTLIWVREVYDEPLVLVF